MDNVLNFNIAVFFIRKETCVNKSLELTQPGSSLAG